MKFEEYHAWKNKMKTLEAALSEDPTNVSIAQELWETMRLGGKYDVTSGWKAIECFSAAALQSPKGVLALARAFKELARDAGEYPRSAEFSPALVEVIKKAECSFEGQDRKDIEWFLTCINS